MKKFHLVIATPEGKAFDGEIVQISLMGESGSLSILADHIPFITNVKKGNCRIYDDEGIIECETTGGILSVTRECVRIIATSFKVGILEGRKE